MSEITMAEFARRKGVYPKAVQDAVKSGRITRKKNGKIDESQLDAWEANRDMSKVRGNAKEPVGAEVQAGSVVGTFQKAKAQKEVYNSLKVKMEYEILQGKYLEKDAVQVAAYNRGRTIRDSVLNIPDRVSAEVAAALVKEYGIKADVTVVDRIVHHIFERETRAVLSDLSKALEV